MKAVLVTLIYMFVSCSWSFGQSANDILWKEQLKLSFDDFRQLRNARLPYSAISFIEIKYQTKYVPGGIEVHVTASFNRSKSWVVKKSMNERLIAHEQGHFDIAEIFARKMRRELRSISVNKKNFNKKIRRCFDRTLEKFRAFSFQYDLETSHGRNTEVQKLWFEKIDSELNELMEYSSYYVRIEW